MDVSLANIYLIKVASGHRDVCGNKIVRKSGHSSHQFLHGFDDDREKRPIIDATQLSLLVVVSLSPTKFDEMVADGRMPSPRLLSVRRRAWDVRTIDAAIDLLPLACEDSDVTWGDIDAA